MSNEWMPPEDGQNGPPQGGGQPYGQNQPGGSYPPPPPMGAMPSSEGGVKSKPPVPQSLQLAVKGMYVGAALSLLTLIVGLFSKGAIRDAVEKANSTNRAKGNKVLTPDQIDTAVMIGFATAIVLGIIGIGLWLLMARTNQAGQGWARIVATVLAVLYVLTTLSSFARAGNTTINSVISIVTLILAIAITVMLYRPDSNQYFAQCKALRQGR